MKSKVFKIGESVYSEFIYHNFKHNLTALGNYDSYTVKKKHQNYSCKTFLGLKWYFVLLSTSFWPALL